ncbi:STAS domain-containing protein [Amycolatopsis australiensis]|uniref:Anti-anti-sigma factor n=1 Tax=Amycolatopsis australiensis TaxID=546364 RepID=A0A1K1SIH7_9PSEU|nr:STAS domain-containing protein [Amycolatopsis australiensis]SFW84153.1 anti-anti-sigma factor [Amycolatopsis australiensis]
MTTYRRPAEVRVAPCPVHRLPAPRAPADEPLRSQVRWKSPDAIVVEVAGDVDLATAAELEAALCEHVRARPRALRVDLGDVTFLGTAGLQALRRAHLLAERSGVHLVFDAGESRAVTRALEVLDRLGENPLPTS